MFYTPKAIYIETTNKCNAACIMCPHKKMRRDKIIMSDEMFRVAVTKCAVIRPVGTQIFFHKEGEPLLDEKIASRIAFAKKFLGKGNELGLNTNAMLLTEKISENLIVAGLNTIYFSVDGTDKISYEAIRLRLNYETVVENIRRFFFVRQKLNANIRVIMQMLVQNDAENAVEQFKNIWRDFDCEFYIKRMHSYLDGGHSSLTQKISERQIQICPDPSKILVIYSNGNVGLCCWDYDNEYSLGNILDDNLLNIYNNDKANRLREYISNYRGHELTPCNRCARIFGEDEITASTEDCNVRKN